jgi:hypothetical protein
VDVLRLQTHERDLLGTIAGVHIEHGMARLDQHSELGSHPIITSIRDAEWHGFESTKVDRDVIRRAKAAGLILEHDGIAFHIDALTRFSNTLEDLWSRFPDGFKISHVGEATGLTRKVSLPLMVCTDTLGLTKRMGDVRVPGPKFPRRNLG